jgi:HSP20 family protein
MLPGLDEKDVDIRLSDGILVISGEKRTESEDKNQLSATFYGRFERRIPLDDIDQDKASAAFKNGVLTVTLPRSSEARSKVRRIDQWQVTGAPVIFLG